MKKRRIPMAEYVYPAVFHPNDDGSFTITFPDLPGCISEGKNLPNALYMAQDALTQWIDYLLSKGKSLPSPSRSAALNCTGDDFFSYIRAEIKDNRAVRRTVSLPKWRDDRASAEGLSLSRILQDSLNQRFRNA